MNEGLWVVLDLEEELSVEEEAELKLILNDNVAVLDKWFCDNVDKIVGILQAIREALEKAKKSKKIRVALGVAIWVLKQIKKLFC